MDIALMNWPAVIVGTIVAYALTLLWFSPKLFGNIWAAGSHNIKIPVRFNILQQGVQLIGILLLALIVGITATGEALFTAVGAILAVAFVVAGNSLHSQKSAGASAIDGAYVVIAGILMIVCQGVL